MKALAIALLGLAAVAPFTSGQSQRHSQLVIVVDGLRPDYVTPDVMPRLSRLGGRGTVFTAHHSVLPTVTRVNAATFVTGVYPEAHGLLGNTIYLPSVDPLKGLDTGDRATMERAAKTEGRLLTAPTLAELLERSGQRLLVASGGSSGSAFVLNSVDGAGTIVHPEFTAPQSLDPKVRALLGAGPEKAMPNDAQNRYAVDGYLKVGVGQLRPDVTILWLSDPDSTAHTKGIGAELSRQSLVLVDAAIGRIEDELSENHLLDTTNIIVTSDHGFSTHTGELRLSALVQPFAKKLPDGTSDIVVVEGAIYLRSSADRETRTAAIVAALQQRPEVGAIFTAGEDPARGDGVVPGTLSFNVARWAHARSGAILVSGNWTDQANSAGFRGTTTQTGVAGHGTSSPFDVHNTLIAAGPDFRVHATSEVPTGNVDIAPTVLRLAGLPVPPTMQGRVIAEGLRDTSASPTPVQHRQVRAATADGRYQVTAFLSVVNGHEYLDYTEVVRH